MTTVGDYIAQGQYHRHKLCCKKKIHFRLNQLYSDIINECSPICGYLCVHLCIHTSMPEGIYVRWYRPAEKMLNKDARNAETRNGSATSVNRDSDKD